MNSPALTTDPTQENKPELDDDTIDLLLLVVCRCGPSLLVIALACVFQSDARLGDVCLSDRL